MLNVLAWILVAALAIAIGRRRAGAGRAAAARPHRRLHAAGPARAAALEPSRMGERLAVGLGAPLLAAVTFALLRGYAALAVACGLTVGAYALDVVAGSPLTTLSLLGPNPGARRPLLRDRQRARGDCWRCWSPAGVGAALAAWGPSAADLARRRGGDRLSRRRRCSPPSSSPPGASAPTSAPRSCCPPGPRSPPPSPPARRRRAAVLLIAAAPVLAWPCSRRSTSILGGGAHLTRSVLRRRRRRRPRRRRPAAARALGEELRPQRDLALPLHHRRGAGAGFRLPPADRRAARRAAWSSPASPARAAATVLGTLANDSGRRAADDRHRVSPRLRGVRLGRELAAKPLTWRRVPCVDAHRAGLAIFLDLSGRRQPARRGSGRGVHSRGHETAFSPPGTHPTG